MQSAETLYRQRLRRQRLTSFGLFLLMIALFALMIWSSVDRALYSATFPATATIPTNLGANLGFVSDLTGFVEYQVGEGEPQTLGVGDTILAGQDSRLAVVGSGSLRLSLPNGTVLYLDDDSELVLRSIAVESASRFDTIATLQNGRLLAANLANEQLNFRIFMPNGSRAQLEGNGVIGMTYETDVQIATVDCLEGECELMNRERFVRQFDGGAQAQVFQANTPAMTGEASYGVYSLLAEPGLLPTSTPPPIADQIEENN